MKITENLAEVADDTLQILVMTEITSKKDVRKLRNDRERKKLSTFLTKRSRSKTNSREGIDDGTIERQ